MGTGVLHPECTRAGRRSRGFSLIELMITVAVIGMIAAIALPAYESYIDTANMAKVNAAYQSGMRTAQNVFAKAKTNAALGLPLGIPESLNKKGKPKKGKQGKIEVSEGWMAILNPTEIQAPGGGLAYVPAQEVAQSDANETGAIRVDWNPNTMQLTLWRPKYIELTRYRAIIDQESVATREFKN